MIRNYLAALLPGLILLVASLQAALDDQTVDQTEAGQLLALLAGVITTYLVPLLRGRWAGGLKTGAAILAAIATLILPLILGFTPQDLVIVIYAALSALATEIGAKVREDGQRDGRHEAKPVTVNITAAPGTSESALAAEVLRAQKEQATLGARR
ncbi:hypothetical protein GRS96_12310 [Rathayibacter sp. VKM Ac-2803]|uniref:hypothetical protein n=1 Tax=Rathayibacter sp. VKM Ac-2803 TaxID=2609256 RepID=UPI001356FEF8|nr:hypothetical protein [Rathayibacter sp. VKM Ac-2803]MWV50052.1 hypothetical protein [Rathayibacter sp. VKM Ac-2803]